MSENNSSQQKRTRKNESKKPSAPKAKLIAKTKYFKVSSRDSRRIRNIKEGMNHLFDQRNRELEEAFLQEATQYTERVLGESRKINFTEEEDHEAMDVVFNNSIEDLIGEGLSTEEEIIAGKEEERIEREVEEDSETLNSEEVWELNERIEREDQEEYDRIRAEMEEEEAEDNKK